MTRRQSMKYEDPRSKLPIGPLPGLDPRAREAWWSGQRKIEDAIVVGQATGHVEVLPSGFAQLTPMGVKHHQHNIAENMKQYGKKS